MSPKRLRKGPLISPARVVAPIAVKGESGIECVRAPGTAADHQIDAEVFQGRVEHLFDVGEQAVNLVDKGKLAAARASSESR